MERGRLEKEVAHLTLSRTRRLWAMLFLVCERSASSSSSCRSQGMSEEGREGGADRRPVNPHKRKRRVSNT